MRIRRTSRRSRRAVALTLALAGAIVLAACAPAPPAPPAPTLPSVPGEQPNPDAGAAANRMIFWTKCWDVVSMSDADLDRWRSQGVGGFVCKLNYLYGLGGDQSFTGDPNSPLAGTAFSLQKAIRDTGIVQRAATRDIKLWLGIGANSYWTDQAPFAEWFDEGTWANSVLPNLRNLAAGMRTLGFAGIAWDEELYPGKSGIASTWNWNYRGNTRSEADVRAQVRHRGAQVMEALVAGYPDVELVTIGWRLPEGWEELVQQEVNGVFANNARSVSTDFWNGLTSVAGYKAIRFMDSVFNKTPHLYKSSWQSALMYNANRLYSLFSRRFSNWEYASSRVHVAPFAWIDTGPAPFEASRPPEHVRTQLAAFRQWSAGGVFANYAYQPLRNFDYTPWVPAMQGAAVPGAVDTQPPTIDVAGARPRNGATVTLTGAAGDDMGVRAVRWRTATGRTGAATMNWVVTSGDWAAGYEWRTDWSADVPALPGEAVTLTVEDIKGIKHSVTVAG